MLRAKAVGVPIDENGIRVDIIEYLINKFKPKFIYTIPNFQNPTGITMSLERRYEVMKIVEKYCVPIIEDDPYGELRYEGEALPALKALDKINIDVVIPDEVDRDIVHEVIYEELCKGIINEASREKYKKIIDRLALKGAEGIVLGCTEIPLLIKQEDVDIPVFDTTTMHAVSAVEFALNK